MEVIAQSATEVAGAVDNTAAYLAFIGVIVVALITAGTAQWRLWLQLRHEREMSDLEEIRKILDATMETVDAAIETTNLYLNRLISMPKDADPEDEKRKEAEELLEQLAGQATAIGAHYRRLALRLSVNHPISKLVLELQARMTRLTIMGMDDAIDTDPETPERIAVIEYVRDRIRHFHFSFLDTAFRLTGVKLKVKGKPQPTTTPEGAVMLQELLEDLSQPDDESESESEEATNQASTSERSQ